jgi:ABC-type glycerol-3-phosphate transport system permease component
MSWHIANYEIVLSGPLVLMLCILPTILSVVPIVRIVQRAGFSGWWTLIILVPVANMVALWYFAFTQWPAQRKVQP